MDGSDINSANRQTQAGNIYYIQNNYEVVYENSGNTHNFKMQDIANHSNCKSPPLAHQYFTSNKVVPFVRSTSQSNGY
jgi:hypothetical protein